MTSIRRLGAALFALTVSVSLAAPVSPAGAAPSASADRLHSQIPFARAAGLIKKAVDRDTAAGFAGLALEDDAVELWWKGALPEGVRSAVAIARTAVPVRVGAAEHSLAELRAAGARLRAGLSAGKPRIKYAVDGSRVVVGVDLAAGFDRASVPSVGVPVEVVDQGRKIDVSRYDDWAPWAGGNDNINYSQGTRCTGGFPVRNGANQRFLLTAGHCGSNGQAIYDSTGEFMGTFSNDNDGHDLGMVATPGNVRNQMYIGGLNSNDSRTVEGWDWVWPGEYLCQSGGSSARDIGGPVCNLRVEKFNTDPGDAVEARQVDGRTAVRGGDSGGPVYAYSASGNIIAKGINCYTYVGNDTILGFQDFGTATRDYGVWIAS